jgi:hypothetical protein
MIAGPVLRAVLLKRTVALPGAMLCPSPLLLPRNRLLLRPLRWLLLPGLLGTLRLRLLRALLSRLGVLLLLPARLLRLRLLLPLRLLGPLRLRLLLPRLLSSLRLGLGRLRVLLRLRLLGPLRLRLLSRSCVLLRLRLLGPLRLRLLSRSCVLLLRLLVLFLPACRLGVRRDNRPEKQKQGGTRGSNELHINPPLRSPLSVHADDQLGLSAPISRLPGLRVLLFAAQPVQHNAWRLPVPSR